MKKEDLFRAISEVSEEQIDEARTPPKRISWQRYAALAACLALIVTAALTMPRFANDEIIQDDTSNRDVTADQGAADSGMDGDPDGYQSLDDARADEKNKLYSTNVEIGQLDGAPAANDSTSSNTSPSLSWLEPEEIFARETDIFRGTVEDLYYYVTEGGFEHYFTVAVVSVSEVYALRCGSLSPGDTCTIYLPIAPGFSTSIAGDLEQLEIGSEAIFMPYATHSETGIRSGENYFCYADVADYYFSEGIRFLFLDTGRGLSFERNVYSEIADALTLDEVAEYIQSMLDTGEQNGETEVNTTSCDPSISVSDAIVSWSRFESSQPKICIGVPLYEEN